VPAFLSSLEAATVLQSNKAMYLKLEKQRAPIYVQPFFGVPTISPE